MEFIAEIIADIVLALGIFIVKWCIEHKNMTFAIVTVILMVIDVIYLTRVLKS